MSSSNTTIPEFDVTPFLNNKEIFPDVPVVDKERRLRKPSAHDPQIIHILKKINPAKAIFNIIIPLYCLFILIFSRPRFPDSTLFLIICITYYFLTISCFSIGYHRYFTHHSFQCTALIQYIFAIFGASIGMGSIWEFSAQHLLHHRFVDTEKDPFNKKYGWLFHMWGHNLFYGNKKAERAYLQMMSDISKVVYNHKTFNNIILWQHENYGALLLITLFVIPLIVSFSVKHEVIDIWTSVFYLGLCRMSIIQQQWLLAETLGHHFPKILSNQNYDDTNSSLNMSSQNLFLTTIFGILTFGETQHNYHHEFSSDYRNSNKWYVIDPNKYIVFLLNKFGLVWKLNKTDPKQVKQAELQQEQRILDKWKSKLNWGVPIDKLPILTPQQFTKMAKREFQLNKRALVCIEGIVHDVTPWINDHPGGPALLTSAIGKDATLAFNGAVYSHSSAARNVLANMRIAVVISESQNNVVWGESTSNNKDVDRVRLERKRHIDRKTHYAAGAA
ncbi:uncharacterized protein SCODWIG_00719 [Saccharomycodes ludwigii]|uniref:Acyl-CoA desaturase n=1 Tax=Saccharomycodes ludwigii TaxID=36035 RepID=A0A376B2P7_9ASCO|nr:hypothetical protein SCDLUD_004606 [Saccharomycodes ludwigii]KAH3899177.1 hypothetical protein SCDLUD_004606 [Saccharomycodes ludwigii]SSD58958.1 uncharacterized protein SCODWIG_00719 [Saccharomycodes ludwigii]